MAIIEVKNLFKGFTIPHERRDSIKEHFINVFRPGQYEAFNAIDNLSFGVNEGEFFGIIGRNGSGKSTLLKMLAGIYPATKGSITVKGRVAPFLELGVGFNPELTGRENVYLNASILGLTEKQIKKRYDEIVQFAELERFMDQKLKNYSSGMHVRLAFSIAMEAGADIILLDEVLAVGDANFQRKCFEKFREFKSLGKTVVFVTHDLTTVRQFCDRVLYIKGGREMALGPTNEVIDKYIYEDRIPEVKPVVKTVPKSEEQKNELPTERGAISRGGTEVEIETIEFIDKFGHLNDTFLTGDYLGIKIKLISKIAIDSPNIGFIIYDEKNNYIFGSNIEIKGVKLKAIKKGNNIYTIAIPKIPMLTGRYYLTVAISNYAATIEYVWKDRLYPFYIANSTRSLGMIEIDYNYDKKNLL